MSALSQTFENMTADALLGGGTITKPATVYVALLTSASSDTAIGTEVSAGGYSRVAVTNDATNFANASLGVKKNTTAIVFPTASGTWGTITAWAIMTASSGSGDQAATLMFHGTFDTAKSVISGDTPQIPADELILTFD